MQQAANDNRVTEGSGEAPARSRPCPICGKPSVVEARPFCSKRCADIDLHRWLGGRYAVPITEEDDSQSDPDGADH